MHRLLPVVIGILSVVAFLPALDGEFLTRDDDVNFLANESYRGLAWPQIRWAFSNVRMGHYIPLTWLSLSGNYVAGGMNPWGYHLVNLLLHAATAIPFYFVARRLLAATRDGGRQVARRCTRRGSCRRGPAASAKAKSSSGRRSNLTPDDPEIHRNLGLALWEQGRTDAAGEHLERAAALRSGDAEAERLMAQFRADPGRPPRLR